MASSAGSAGPSDLDADSHAEAGADAHAEANATAASGGAGSSANSGASSRSPPGPGSVTAGKRKAPSTEARAKTKSGRNSVSEQPSEEPTAIVHAYLRDKKKVQFKAGPNSQWQTPGTHARWKLILADDGVTSVVEIPFFGKKFTWCDGFADAHPVGTEMRLNGDIQSKYAGFDEECLSGEAPWDTLRNSVFKRLQRKGDGTKELLEALCERGGEGSDAVKLITKAKSKTEYMPAGCCDSCLGRPTRCVEAFAADRFDPVRFKLVGYQGCPCARLGMSWCGNLFDLLSDRTVGEFKAALARIPSRELSEHVNCFHGCYGPNGPVTLLHVALLQLRGSACVEVVALLLKAGADKEAQAYDRRTNVLLGHKPIWADAEICHDVEVYSLLLDEARLAELADAVPDDTLSPEAKARLRKPANLLKTCTKSAVDGSDNSGTPLYVAMHSNSRCTLQLKCYLLAKTREQLEAAETRANEDAVKANPNLWQKLRMHAEQKMSEQYDFLKRLHADDLEAYQSKDAKLKEQCAKAGEKHAEVAAKAAELGLPEALTTLDDTQRSAYDTEMRECNKLYADCKARSRLFDKDQYSYEAFRTRGTRFAREQAEAKVSALAQDNALHKQWKALQWGAPEWKELRRQWNAHAADYRAGICHPRLQDDMRKMHLRILLEALKENDEETVTEYLRLDTFAGGGGGVYDDIFQRLEQAPSLASGAGMPPDTPFSLLDFIIALVQRPQPVAVQLLTRVIERMEAHARVHDARVLKKCRRRLSPEFVSKLKKARQLLDRAGAAGEAQHAADAEGDGLHHITAAALPWFPPLPDPEGDEAMLSHEALEEMLQPNRHGRSDVFSIMRGLDFSDESDEEGFP